jgi:hypothetical protein
MTAGELTVKLSEEEVEKRLNDETAKEESVAEWPSSAIEEKNNMRDHDDLPTNKERKQPRILHKES